MTLLFDHGDVPVIEAALQGLGGGRWRRAHDREVSAVSGLGFVAAWRVQMPLHVHEHPLVDHVFVGIPQTFPWAEPRVVAPQARSVGAPAWPHVESEGLLCLRTTRFSADSGARVLTMLEYARDVLDMDLARRRAEFEREFAAYWSHSATRPEIEALSLLDLGNHDDREIMYWRRSVKRLVFAEDAEALRRWARHLGEPDPGCSRTLFTALSEPWTPDAFPAFGRDVIDGLGAARVVRCIQAGEPLPVVFAATVGRDVVLAGVQVEGASASVHLRGFRPSHPKPASMVASTYRAKAVRRFNIRRADAAWVHGRARDPTSQTLRERSVAVVGCGALGGFVARGLLQAGVGTILLVDHDRLEPNNVGRHVLGLRWVHENKADALAAQLGQDFPHTVEFKAFPQRFQALSPDALRRISECDLLVLGGVDLDAELAISTWRSRLTNPMPMLWTFIEEFAVAGHAVLLPPGERLESALDSDASFKGRVTSNWPTGVGQAVEPGCAVAFHSYSAVDASGTVQLAIRLAIRSLLGDASGATIRTWVGDRQMAIDRGARVDSQFDREFCETERHWPL